jgi:hypothetical protein
MIRHSILISHTRFPFQEFHPVGNEVWNPTGEGGGGGGWCSTFNDVELFVCAYLGSMDEVCMARWISWLRVDGLSVVLRACVCEIADVIVNGERSLQQVRK